MLFACVMPHASAQVAITEGGTASYAVPVAVPPGIAGMSPNIGLTYSGGGVNGPVGHGWGIQGISTITRCSQTRGIDGFVRGVAFDVDDKLCLDGQRLIQTDASGVVVSNPLGRNTFQSGDSAGGSGTGAIREFRTEKDSFARIRAYGSANNDPTNGPAYFKVWTKSGQVYEYGAGPSADANTNALVAAQGSAKAMVWAVSRISDTLSNYIDFKYIQRDTAWGTGPSGGAQLGREWNLVEIQYTGNGARQPANKVVFDYVDRADNPNGAQDRAEAYQMGSKNVSISRLRAIRTYVNWSGPALGVNAQGTSYPAVPVSPTSAGNVITPPAGAIKVKTVKITYGLGATTGRSLVSSIQECGGAGEGSCSPATTFQYSSGGGQSFQTNAAFLNSPLVTTKMIDVTAGNFGVVLGDFDGDGRTDLLRWGNAPSDNQLWLSNGDGSFRHIPEGSGTGQFNLAGQQLFSSDGCYTSTIADFNGDGIGDILRTVQTTNTSGGACGAGTNQLYLGNGDGSFQAPIALTGIDLATVTEKFTSTSTSCTLAFEPPRDGDVLAQAAIGIDLRIAQTGGQCYNRAKSIGKSFYLLDVNGDGLLDIVTTMTPPYYVPYSSGNSTPTPDEQCASTTCTHVYLGNRSGTVFGFNELTPTTLANHSVYSGPVMRGQYAALVRPNTVDVDGDGLADLVVSTGTWLSAGNGNFTRLGTDFGAPACANPIDLNGDGRVDCVTPGASASTLQVTTGLAPLTITNFTPAGASNPELYVWNATTQQQSAGMLIGDFTGDGRSGILRWEDDPGKNALYLSNGDGTFRTAAFNLTVQKLRTSDGIYSYLSGDFTGRGSVEILRMKDSPVAGSDTTMNVLYEKADKTPPDQLISVTSPTGLNTALTWVPLTSSLTNTPNNPNGSYPRYAPDRGGPNAAQYPQVDLMMPMYVVATSVSDTGVGNSQLTTEYAYAGLKADINRGLLGFRETRRQTTAPNGGPLVQVTQYLQTAPYIGATSKTQTYASNLWSAVTATNPLSTSVLTYCDKTAPAGSETSASSTTPCSTTAKVQKPYLYSTVESGVDLSGAVLPQVTTVNTFDQTGNPTSIAITTAGTALGLSQTFTKTTSNIYQVDNTSGDNWVLGRLQQASQRNTVPNSLSSIVTSAGGAPNASGTQGNGAAPPATISPAVLSAILQLLLDD